MNDAYWHRQSGDEPLFPDLLWSRPESRRHAGKLLIIGGNLHGFAAPAEAYSEAVKAGIGTARVLLPDSVKKLAGHLLETVDYAPSAPSGSFSKQALAEFIDHSAWADAVLLAGDLGRNSETAIALETFLQKYQGPVVLTKDAVDYLYNLAEAPLNRPQTTLVLSLAQLQKLTVASGFTRAVTFGMDLIHLVDFLHGFTTKYPVNIVVKHLETILVAVGGQVSTTKLHADLPIWRVRFAAHSSVWWLQNPDKTFESLTTAINIDAH